LKLETETKSEFETDKKRKRKEIGDGVDNVNGASSFSRSSSL
jgi:hypothetical protein